MSQGLLFGPDDAPTAKPAGDGWQQMRVLITVKAAPNPSETYGETVCVAGIRLDFDAPGWVRLYPINFRELDSPHTFKKYDIVSLRAKPARGDFRTESWRPDITSVHTVDHLKPWTRRRVEVEPYVDASMCAVREAVHANSAAPSLAAVRPDRVLGIDLKPHPGWSPEDQRKIDRYVGQPDLTGGDHAGPGERGHRVQLRPQDQWYLGQQQVAQHAATDPGQHPQRRRHRRVQAELERFLGPGHREHRQAHGIEHPHRVGQ